jgi:hypothetical protein
MSFCCAKSGIRCVNNSAYVADEVEGCGQGNLPFVPEQKQEDLSMNFARNITLAVTAFVALSACSEKQQDSLGNAAEVQGDKLEQQADRLENVADNVVDAASAKLDDAASDARNVADAAKDAGDRAAQDIENAARR